MTRKELAASYAAKQAAIKALTDKGLDNLTQEEAAQLATELDARDAVKADLDKFPKDDALKARVSEGDTFIKSAPLGVPYPGAGGQAKAAHEAEVKGQIESGETEMEKYVKKGPWKGLGHFAYEVKRCGTKQSGMVNHGTLGEWNKKIAGYDDAIKAMGDVKATGGLTEFSDPDGAAFVPPDTSNTVWQRVMSPADLMGKVVVTPVQGNGFTLVAWNDASWTSNSVYGGARAYWTDEATQITTSKPATRKVSWKLNKLAVLMNASDELLDDTVALDSRLSVTASMAFKMKLNDAIINGTGSGQPLGLLNCPAKITATAVSGQGVNTIVATNIDDMYRRRAPGLDDWEWLYIIDSETQLSQLNYANTVTNTGIAAAFRYQPGIGWDNKLKNRPATESFHCQALGTEGDLILWSPSQYQMIVKSTGINSAVSMHLYFDYDQAAFRWTFRCDGRPFWDAALTPYNGSTRSPIVTLNSTRT